jgi:hypothetical protein
MSDKIVTIEKLDSVKVRQEKLPYTIHMNYVLQNVRHPLALAIWVYLSSLPADWKVHRNQLMEHFDVGRDKLGDALKYLNSNNLIEYLQEKTDGKFGISHIIVKNGYDFELIHKNNTALLKNRTTDFPDNGETAPTKEIKTTYTKKDKKPFCLSDQQKKKKDQSWPKKNDTPFSDPTTQSNSFKPLATPMHTESNLKAFEKCMESIGKRRKNDACV